MTLSDAEVDRELPPEHGWRRIDQELIVELRFKDFEEALRFVERVGTEAVDYVRRPDMCIVELNRVRLTIANRHHAGITLAEIRLARKVDAILAEHHPHVVVPGPAPPGLHQQERR
jgi:4a-hydroxytetrahydrobiopterin dehydratase